MAELVENNKITRDGRALIQAYQKMVQEACAPIFWGSKETGEIKDNGTVIFAELEGQTIALTAAHVAEALASFIEEGGTACRIGKADFFTPPLFTRHPKPAIDIAFYCLDPHLVSLAGAKPVSFSMWPLQPARDGEIMLLGGFPGVFRNERESEVNFEFFFYTGRVDGCIDHQMRILLDLENSNPLTQEKIDAGFRLGGCSGGPVFRHIERGFMEHIELAGIISDGVSSFECFYAHELSSLTKEGDFSTETAS